MQSGLSDQDFYSTYSGPSDGGAPPPPGMAVGTTSSSSLVGTMMMMGGGGGGGAPTLNDIGAGSDSDDEPAF